MQESKDPSGMPDNGASGQSQETQQSTDASGGRNTVAYASHQKVLNEKKKWQSDFVAMETEFNQMKEDKLSAEGKKDELLDAYKKRVGDLEGKVNDFAFSSVSNAVKLKANSMGCVDDDAIVKFVDLTTLNIGDGFSVDSSEVSVMLDSLKKERPYLFKTVNPNVHNDTPSTNPNVGTGGIDFGKMSKEELKAYGRKHGL